MQYSTSPILFTLDFWINVALIDLCKKKATPPPLVSFMVSRLMRPLSFLKRVYESIWGLDESVSHDSDIVRRWMEFEKMKSVMSSRFLLSEFALQYANLRGQ